MMKRPMLSCPTPLNLTLSRLTLSRLTLSRLTLSRLTLSRLTLSRKGLFMVVALCPLWGAGLFGVRLPGERQVIGARTARAQQAQGAAVSAENLLSAMANAGRRVKYTGTEVMARNGAPAIRMRVWRDGARRRYEFVAPPVRQGDVLVDDGSKLWLYHRKDKTAVQTLGRNSDAWRLNADRMRRGFKARVIGVQKVAGRRAWVVQLTPRQGKGASYKFWIDQATKARLRRERYNADGRRDLSTTLTSVTFGPVAPSRFQWSPPPGAKVTLTSGTLYSDLARARGAASWLQYPRYTPRGYLFESAVVDASKGEAWLRYTNGRTRFSIFQQRVKGGPAGGSPTPNKYNGGWYWKRGDSRFLAVGIPVSQVQNVAQSMS